LTISTPLTQIARGVNVAVGVIVGVGVAVAVEDGVNV
jgi:hypothetical protein